MNDNGDGFRCPEEGHGYPVREIEQLLTSGQPSPLGERIARELADYSVAFVASRDGELEAAGSGTLISFRDSHYILTAAHVWHGNKSTNGLKKADSILIPIKEGEPKRLIIPPKDIEPFGPQIPEKWNEWGPDIVMLRLRPDLIGRFLAVGRSFYNLSKKKERQVEGVKTYFLVGAPQERGTYTTEKSIPEVQAMLLWEGTGPYLNLNSSRDSREDFDYIDLCINTSAPDVAKRFGGVSGGALWAVEIYESDGGGFDSFKDPIGVPYWEYPIPESTLLKVTCHGPQSIGLVLRYAPK
jgi:hypothetical protein